VTNVFKNSKSWQLVANLVVSYIPLL